MCFYFLLLRLHGCYGHIFRGTVTPCSDHYWPSFNCHILVMLLEKLLPIMFCYSVSKCKMKLLTEGIRELLAVSYTESVCLFQGFEKLFQWDRTYLTVVVPNSIWWSEVKINAIVCMLDSFKCNGGMAKSFRVFVLSALVQSRNWALIV